MLSPINSINDYLELTTNSEEKIKLAKDNKNLDILINDKYWLVRMEVAKQGYGLSVLINDENDNVRDMAKLMIERLKRQGNIQY